MELPERIEKTCYIFAYTTCEFLGGEFLCSFHDLSGDDDKILITSFEISIDVPKDINFGQVVIDSFKEQREGIVTKYSIALKKIEDKIKDLQCLTHIKGSDENENT